MNNTEFKNGYHTPTEREERYLEQISLFEIDELPYWLRIGPITWEYK